MAAVSPQTLALAGRRAGPLLELLALQSPQAVELVGQRLVPMVEFFAGALGGRTNSVLSPSRASSSRSVASAHDERSFLSTDRWFAGSLRGLADLMTKSVQGGFLGQISACGAVTLLTQDVYFPSSTALVPCTTRDFRYGPLQELGSLSLRGVLPMPAFSNVPGSGASKLSILCLGATAGLLLFNAQAPPPSPPPEPTTKPPAEGEQKEPDNDDERLKEILRLVKKITQDMVVKEVKKPFWLFTALESFFGETFAGNTIYLAKLVKDQWKKFYMVYVFGFAMFTLEISPPQLWAISRYYLHEEQEGLQKALAAYARNSQRKEDGDESVSAVSLSVLNLETHELNQIQLYMRGEGGLAVLKLLEGWSLSQPNVKEGLEINQSVLFLKTEDSAALLQHLQAIANGKKNCDPPSRPDDPPSLPN